MYWNLWVKDRDGDDAFIARFDRYWQAFRASCNLDRAGITSFLEECL